MNKNTVIHPKLVLMCPDNFFSINVKFRILEVLLKYRRHFRSMFIASPICGFIYRALYGSQVGGHKYGGYKVTETSGDPKSRNDGMVERRNGKSWNGEK